MKMIVEFIRATLIGGFFIVLPLLLIYILLGETLEAVIGLATPIADLFPAGTFEDTEEPVVLAVILILLASVVLGMATRLPLVHRFGGWLEDQTVGRLPLYQTIKSLTSRLASMDVDRFKPALVHGPGGQRELAYLMEDLGDGYAAVMIPRAPTPMAGSVKLVPISQVEVLDVSLGELTTVITHWGVGTRALMKKTR